MKKEAGFFLTMMCVLTLAGCGTLNNAEKAEDKISQSAVEESIASEEINVVSASGDEAWRDNASEGVGIPDIQSGDQRAGVHDTLDAFHILFIGKQRAAVLAVDRQQI